MVTLDDLKAHLNITFDADDALITAKLAAAQSYVGRWVGGDLETVFSTGTPADLDEAVRQLAAHFYANREAVNVQEGRTLVLPYGVEDLIAPYRVWAF